MATLGGPHPWRQDSPAPRQEEMEEDESVLEAQRHLTQYLEASKGGPAPPWQASWPSGGRVPISAAREREAIGKLEDLLTDRVCSLGTLMLQHDAMLRDIRAELSATGPDLHQVAEDNAMLARTNQEISEEAAEWTAAHSKMKGEAAEFRRKVEELQEERDELLTRFACAQEAETAAREESDWAQRDLDMERRHCEERTRALGEALVRRRERAGEVEERAAAAQRELARLEHTSSQAAVAARALADGPGIVVSEVDLHQQVAQYEAALQGIREQRRREAFRVHMEAQEVAEARAESWALERHAEALATELAASERRAEDTNRKALAVARELRETSQAMGKFRAEAEQHRELRQELAEAQCEQGLVEQRIEAAWRRASPPLRGRAHNSEQGARSATSVASRQTSPAEAELQRLRVSQELAVHEALRSSWEAEARERKEKEAKLKALEATWRPLSEGLLRLNTIAHRWREELCIGAASLASVPQPPLESAWSNEGQLPDAAQALCDCLEALSMEGARRLAQARTQKRFDLVARSSWITSPVAGIGDGVSSLSSSSP